MRFVNSKGVQKEIVVWTKIAVICSITLYINRDLNLDIKTTLNESEKECRQFYDKIKFQEYYWTHELAFTRLTVDNSLFLGSVFTVVKYL